MTLKEKIVINLMLGLINWLGNDLKGFFGSTLSAEIKKLIKENDTP
jgi:hypothetical protein